MIGGFDAAGNRPLAAHRATGPGGAGGNLISINLI